MTNKFIGVSNLNCYMKSNGLTAVATIDCDVMENGKIVNKLLNCVNDEEIKEKVLELSKLVALKNGYKVGE